MIKVNRHSRFMLVLLSFTLVFGNGYYNTFGAETEKTSVNTPNSEYFQSFEDVTSLSEAGYSYNSEFELGQTEKYGNGIKAPSQTNGLYITGPKGQSVRFTLDAAAFENASMEVEFGYDVYVPNSVALKENVVGYLAFADEKENILQIASRTLQLKSDSSGQNLMLEIISGESKKSDWNSNNGEGKWGANAPIGSISYPKKNIDVKGKWVNLKTRLSYMKDENGDGFYFTKYYMDGEVLTDDSGEPYVFKLQEKCRPSERKYLQFMIYAFSGVENKDSVFIDNLSMKIVQPDYNGLTVSKPKVENSTVTYEYENKDNHDVPYRTLIACYNKDDDSFLGAKLGNSGVIKASSSGKIEESIVPDEESRVYRVFLWSNDGNMVPLSDAAKLEISSTLLYANWITAPSTYSTKDMKTKVGGTNNAMYRFDSLAMWDDKDSDGEMNRNEFTALKLGAAPILRTSFNVAKPIKTATAYVTGLGYYELYMNGQKVGDKILEPFTSLYEADCVYYSKFDVTDLMESGKNGIGAVLGRGTYNSSAENNMGMAATMSGSPKRGKQRLKMVLSIEYSDGTNEVIPTTTAWKASWSPIRYDCQAYGEFFDARMENDLEWSTNGWSKGNYDDSAWKSAELEKVFDPNGVLAPAPNNYNTIVQEYNGLDVKKLDNNTFRADVGRVLTGWAAIKNLNVSQENSGKTITFHYIENLSTWNSGASDAQSTKQTTFYYKDKDGIEQNVTSYAQTDWYVMKEGTNNWQPKFTLKSFRYIDIAFPDGMNVSAEDVKNLLAVEEVHANLEETGSFSSSNEIFNSTHDIAKKTLLNNMHSYISDTPLHENAGYLFDGVASAEWGIYNFDAENYLRKWLRDMRATQKENGKLNASAPVCWLAMAGPEWSEGFAELTWSLYRNSGDREILSENYESLKKLLTWETSAERKQEAEEYAKDKLQDGILPDYIYDSTWGDHVPPSQISGFSAKRVTTITATAFVYREAVLMQQMADILGKTDDAAKFKSLAEDIKSAFNKNFWDEEKGYYHDGKVRVVRTGEVYGTTEFRQTPQIVAIKFGLVEDKNKSELINKLKSDIDAIQAKGYSGFTTGLIGTKYIFEVLSDNGLGEELYEIFNTDKYPGYGYWLKNGATSMWEYWETNKRSDNHHMFGMIDKWFYRYLAGIQDKEAGYKKIQIKPYVLGDMTSASASIESPYGTISSAWSKESDGNIVLEVVVPQKTSATIYVPMGENSSVDAPSGAVLSTVKENGYSVYEVSGGTYQFTAK